MTDWDRIGFIRSSQYREIVLEALDDQPATPSDIATATDIEIQHVSRSLRELRERDIVELLVDESRQKGRIYGITDVGVDIQATITEQLATDGGDDA